MAPVGREIFSGPRPTGAGWRPTGAAPYGRGYRIILHSLSPGPALWGAAGGPSHWTPRTAGSIREIAPQLLSKWHEGRWSRPLVRAQARSDWLHGRLTERVISYMLRHLAANPALAAERIVKAATRTGGPAGVPSEESLKAVKAFSKLSDDHVLHISENVWARLGDRNSHVRLLALGVCAELWPKSRAFRLALVGRLLPDFVQLVFGGVGELTLPPPEDWADALVTRGRELVERWHASHGTVEGYSDLGLVRRYIAAQDVAGAAAAAGGGGSRVATLAAEAATAATRRMARVRAKYDGISAESEERLGQVRRGIEAMEACLVILAPSIEEAAWGGTAPAAGVAAGVAAGAAAVVTRSGRPSPAEAGEVEGEDDDEVLECASSDSDDVEAVEAEADGLGGQGLGLSLCLDLHEADEVCRAEHAPPPRPRRSPHLCRCMYPRTLSTTHL